MEKLYKQFAELGTKWKTKKRTDEFFIARLRLTFYYSITLMIILGGSSFILYHALLNNIAQYIGENVFDLNLANSILDKTQDILLSRFLTIDGLLVILIILLAFLVTQKTLSPIKENMRRHKRFIADASHELRTPIAVVMSSIEVALRNKKLNLEDSKKVLEDILAEMKQFSVLSEHLLNVSKQDVLAGNRNEIISINELIKSVSEKMKQLADDKEITFRINIDHAAFIKGNSIELGRVFYNIINNSINYTLPQGIITIFDNISQGYYNLTIADTGCGISEEAIDKIFDPFFREDSSRNIGGAGLGLTLAKKIIENHSGKIKVKSVKEKGTEVIISLPMSS